MKPVRIIHVDDDKNTVKSFAAEVEKSSDIDYKGGFTNASDALSYLKEHEVDLAFLDIEMPDKDGFWLAGKMKGINTSIVFLTSHTEYMMQAFEACAIHYIVKPAGFNDIEHAIDNWKKQKEKFAGESGQIEELINNYIQQLTTFPKRVFINTVGKTVVIQLDQLMYISSIENYSQFYLIDGSKQLSSRNLKTYSDALHKNPDFVRIHKSHLVNKKFVANILRDKSGKTSLEMNNGVKLEVSGLRKDEILKELLE